MSHQLTADSEFSTKRRQTRKEIFLSRMEQILPAAEYDRCHRAVLSCKAARPTASILETMLRIHCMQHWYNLSDGAMEDALMRNRLHAPLFAPDYPPDGACGPHHHHEFPPPARA